MPPARASRIRSLTSSDIGRPTQPLTLTLGPLPSFGYPGGGCKDVEGRGRRRRGHHRWQVARSLDDPGESALPPIADLFAHRAKRRDVPIAVIILREMA
jgi:hypothetical protein